MKADLCVFAQQMLAIWGGWEWGAGAILTRNFTLQKGLLGMHSFHQTRRADATEVVVEQYGTASQLKVRKVLLPAPGKDEVRVRHTAIGVNFVDVYHRTGIYPLPILPSALGVEAVGIVEAIGAEVDGFEPGQRVAYAGPPVGSYASVRNIPASRLLRVPDGLDDDDVAAFLLRGITAYMLLAHVYPVRRGDTVLIHAAAGGLGLVLVQWAKWLGAIAIGSVSSQAKAALATQYGLDHPILYREQNFVQEVNRLTGGRGVDYVIDGIGGKTLIDSLGAVRPFGMVASIGQVAGDPGPIDLAMLGPTRSVSLSRPGVFRFIADYALYREGAAAAFEALQRGVRAHIGAVFPLAEAAVAHRALESGASTGSLLLHP